MSAKPNYQNYERNEYDRAKKEEEPIKKNKKNFDSKQKKDTRLPLFTVPSYLGCELLMIIIGIEIYKGAIW